MSRTASIPASTLITAEPKGSGRSLPVAVAEGAVLLGGVTLLEHLQFLDFAQLPVHPFFFAVALLSAQYGALGGIASAAAATLLSFSDGAPARPIGQDYFDFTLGAWAPPLTWLAVAVLVGLIADRHFQALDQTHSRLQAAGRERDLIASQYEILAARTRRLERRHAGFSEPAARHGKVGNTGAAMDGGASTTKKNGNQIDNS